MLWEKREKTKKKEKIKKNKTDRQWTVHLKALTKVVKYGGRENFMKEKLIPFNPNSKEHRTGFLKALKKVQARDNKMNYTAHQIRYLNPTNLAVRKKQGATLLQMAIESGIVIKTLQRRLKEYVIPERRKKKNT